jgi:hypothetical protein
VTCGGSGHGGFYIVAFTFQGVCSELCELVKCSVAIVVCMSMCVFSVCFVCLLATNVTWCCEISFLSVLCGYWCCLCAPFVRVAVCVSLSGLAYNDRLANVRVLLHKRRGVADISLIWSPSFISACVLACLGGNRASLGLLLSFLFGDVCLYVYVGRGGTYVQAHFKSQVKGLTGMISIGVAFILLHHISGRPFTFTPLFQDKVDSFISVRVLLHSRQIVVYSLSPWRTISLARPCASGVV